MAIEFNVEDGYSCDPDANSYAEIEWIDQYHENRGNAKWTGLDSDVKQVCAIKASDFIDKRFGMKFRGFRQSKSQGLAWPRLNAMDNDGYMLEGIPLALKKAIAEYALRAAIYNVLAPDPLRPVPPQDMAADDPNANQTDVVVGPVRSHTIKAGPVEESTTYDSSTQLAAAGREGSRAVQSTVVNDWTIPQYPEADMLIEGLLEGSGDGDITLERA